jgi:4-diphosphocytidyl-2-C-methyl-D-erythritol kinase
VSAPVLRTLAPGKVNLSLFLGRRRADGLHDLVSLVQPVSLADELELAATPGAVDDDVICPGVPGTNLAAEALRAFRAATGWREPAVRLTITKRVPVAGGMGGGSADAGAALRLAARAAGHDDPAVLQALAFELGADVPALLEPSLCLVTGAGERTERLESGAAFGLVLIPSDERLSTAAVFREADRLGLARDQPELDRLRDELQAAVSGDGDLTRDELLVNDLEAAACSLCPAIEESLAAVRDAGAASACVSGSGPTVFGLFPGVEGPARAAAAAVALAERFTGASAAAPVGADFAAVHEEVAAGQ